MTRARLLDIAALARRRERERQGLFLVEGIRSVESAVAACAPLVEIVASSEAASEPRVKAMLDAASVPVSVVSAKDAERVSDARTSQGVVAVARAVATTFDRSRLSTGAKAGVVVLDAVQDPGNVGTIIRTAAWFGVSAVIAGPGTADLESPKVVRAAAGGLWDVDLMRAEGLASALDELKDAGFTLSGADTAGDPVESWRPADRLAMVLGGEANGLSIDVRGRLSSTVGIRRVGAGRGVESLNVAVAAGVLMHRWGLRTD